MAAGGLLSSKIGGPSVFPPLGAEFVKITFRSELPWKASPGDDRYRRGMYTFFKRSVPYPDLMIFDCPDASVGRDAARRIEHAAAGAHDAEQRNVRGSGPRLGARGCCRSAPRTDESTRSARRFAFASCGRRIAKESARLVEVLQRAHRSWYDNHPDDAKAMTESLNLRPMQWHEAAALVATANVIMNLDEFITRD